MENKIGMIGNKIDLEYRPKIFKYGELVIKEETIAVIGFTFHHCYDVEDAQILALEWAIRRLKENLW